MRGYTSTASRRYQPREQPMRGKKYIEAGVHCGGCVQISDDTLESSSSWKKREERRVLPMRDARRDEILEVIRDIFNILPLSRWIS